MSKPLAVLISDIHFTIQNLELCSTALRAALWKAEELSVPLNILGDLHEHKAIIRAEVMNRIIQVLRPSTVPINVLVGNHDLCNEKGSEHGLEYLRHYANVIDKVQIINGIVYIPYQNDSDNLRRIVKDYCKEGDTLFMHQGVKGAFMGDYITDKTSIDVELLKDFTCYSGHYHRHQMVGTLTYLGSPFSQSFGEANDGCKGYLVLSKDGTYTREILKLRKHITEEITLDFEGNEFGISRKYPAGKYNCEDLVWIKLYGSKRDLPRIDKKHLDTCLGIKNYKLDKIVIEEAREINSSKKITDLEVLHALINTTKDLEYREYLLKLSNEVLQCE